MSTPSHTNRFRNASLFLVRFHAIVVLISLGCFNGCKDSGTESRAIGNTRMFVLYKDNIAPSGRTVSLTLTTETIYPILGYRILNRIERSGSHIKIYLDGIQPNENGPAALGPASETFQLGTLANGVYGVDFVLGNSTVRSLLTVSEASLSVNMPGNYYLVSNRPVLFRVPSAIIWGSVGSFTSDGCEKFLDSLHALGTSTVILPSGDYYYFSFTPEGGFSCVELLGYRYSTSFIYRYTGDTSAVRNLVKRFGQNYSDSIYVHLYGGRGEMYNSSVLKREQ
jgi:hypothetical protein